MFWNVLSESKANHVKPESSGWSSFHHSSICNLGNLWDRCTPHRFSCPFQVTYPGMFSKAIISIGCSTEEVRHGYIWYLYIYIMLKIYIYTCIYVSCAYIYIYISHKALFVAFCFYPLDIVWCFFLVRGSEISAYGAFECKTKAFHCLWAVCSCCTSFNQLEPWVGAEVHLIAEEQLGEGAANPRKKGLRDSHLLRISYVIIFFLCLPAEHLCCPRIHGMMRSMWFLWRCGSLFCACH